VLSGQNLFSSVQLINSYAGTVTLGDDASGGLSIKTLNVTSGAISQPAPGATDLTVLTTFNWTGGTLNSTANLANLIISGATVNIDPSGGTVWLGDNLSFINGANGTMGDGTLALNKDGTQVVLDSGAALTVVPGALGAFTPQSSGEV
jgi:hypothetical protein